MIDKPGWSLDHICRELQSRCKRVQIDIFPLKNAGNIDLSPYDAAFPLAWNLTLQPSPSLWTRFLTPYQLQPYLDSSHLLTGIHSHRAWDNGHTEPHKSVFPPKKLIRYLQQFRGVNAVSSRLTKLFQDAGLTNISLCENGVNTAFFSPAEPLSSRPFTMGFSGSTKNKTHDKLKGFSQFILPASHQTQTPLSVSGGNMQDEKLAWRDMPNFYRSIDVYICMSSSEGFSQSVLEAAACGIPIISTKVGGCENLIEHGVNGFLIERDLNSLIQHLEILKNDSGLLNEMRKNIRSKTVQSYDWSVKYLEWENFILKHLES